MNLSDHIHDHMHHHGPTSPPESDHLFHHPSEGLNEDPMAAGSHSMHNMENMNMNHMMMMVFHFGTNETILFNSWKVSSAGGIIGSCIGIFLLSTLYECLKYYREYLYFQTNTPWWYRSMTVPATSANNSGSSIDDGNRTMVGEVLHIHRPQPPPMLSRMHILQTFLHAVQIIISYFLMLIFMTYNVWLCLAVLLGAVTGYFLFGWKKSVFVDVTEHCH